MSSTHKEIEVRFLEIDKTALIEKLHALGAMDKGETMLEEAIIYDTTLKWRDDNKFVRLRKNGDTTRLTYKHHNNIANAESKEIELGVSDMETALAFLAELGYVPYRRQEKKRHTLTLGDITFDIDTWPKLPTYVEIEGPSLEAVQAAAQKIGFDWKKAEFHDARWVIENIYKIPVGHMKLFTFERCE